MASACCKWRAAASTRSRGTLSPKNTTSGLSTPPQRGQDGVLERGKVDAVEVGVAVGRFGGMKGRPIRVQRFDLVLHRLRAAPSASQSMQRTWSIRPCRSITAALPAA